jgi:hypothetical protein
MKKIDIFMPPPSEYGLLDYLTKGLNQALNKAGVESRILVADRKDPKPFLESLFSKPADCTLSFNGLLPDEEGRFFCDLIKIPHVALLTESPFEYLALTKSNQTIIGCPDHGFLNFLQGMDFKKGIYFPPAVDSALKPESKTSDLAFFGTCHDFEAIEAHWKKDYSKELCEILNTAVRIGLQNPNQLIEQVIVEVINQQEWKKAALDPFKMDLITLLYEVERVVRGKERVAMVKELKDVSLDLYGSGPWERYLKGKKNVTIHGPISFDKVIKTMQKTKITMNSSPHFKQGVHERIVSSLASGSLPLSNKTKFLEKEFPQNLYFEFGKWDEMNQTLALHLKDQAKREKACEAGRKKVLENYTFDAQVKNLLSQLDRLLEKAKA